MKEKLETKGFLSSGGGVCRVELNPVESTRRLDAMSTRSRRSPDEISSLRMECAQPGPTRSRYSVFRGPAGTSQNHSRGFLEGKSRGDSCVQTAFGQNSTFVTMAALGKEVAERGEGKPPEIEGKGRDFNGVMG
jgi:hypothetical protein